MRLPPEVHDILNIGCYGISEVITHRHPYDVAGIGFELQDVELKLWNFFSTEHTPLSPSLRRFYLSWPHCDPSFYMLRNPDHVFSPFALGQSDTKPNVFRQS